MSFYLQMSKNITQQREFKIHLCFDSCKSSTDWQWNEKCTKSRLKRKRKMLWNKSEKIPYVQIKQKNAKSWKFN